MREKKIILIASIIILFLSNKVHAAAGGVGLAAKPYSISTVFETLPEESQYPTLQYSEWQEEGTFKNIYINGFYILRVRDGLGNISYQPLQIEGLSEKFEVDYVDISTEDKKELNSEKVYVKWGTTVAGSDMGTDTTLSKYYEGYYYDSCTTTTVDPFQKNVVYRNFKIQTFNIVYHNVNGEKINTEIVNYGDGIGYTEEPTREAVVGISDTLFFEFIGWGDIEGNLVDTYRITSDMELYPIFNMVYVPNEVTIFFHFGDAKDTVIRVDGKRGEIEPPEPSREDKDDASGKVWYSFEYWTLPDGSRVYDINSVQNNADLYAYYSEIIVPKYEVPSIEDVELEPIEADIIEFKPNFKQEVEFDVTEIEKIDDDKTARQPLPSLRDFLDENRVLVSTVGTVSLVAVIITAITYSTLGFGAVQTAIFLYALYRKKKRYANGVWLIDRDDIRYVDKYGRDVTVIKDNKGIHFKTKKGKDLNGVLVDKELKKLNCSRITKKEFYKHLKASEVYTVFNKDVRLEVNSVANTQSTLGFNLVSCLKNVSATANHYTMKVINGSKDLVYEINTDTMTI